MYVPILKEKQGEKDAIMQLNEVTKDFICPLFEIAPEHFADAIPINIENYWRNRPYYLDFPYEKITEGIEERVFRNWIISNKSKHMIPVIRLSYEDEIINETILKFEEKIAIRITVDEFFEDDFLENLEKITDQLTLENVDLIIDSQEITASSYKKQAASVKTCLNDIPNLQKYNSIVLASGSFPPTLDIDKEVFLTIGKHEIDFFKLIKKSFSNFNLVFSDYGINHWTSFEFIPGMQPSFNIRYTLNDNYLVYKGKTIKKGGLKIENIKTCCIDLINSPNYFGSTFSWGDSVINDIADGTKNTGGNLTTWRAIATNHHIEAVIKQLANLFDT